MTNFTTDGKICIERELPTTTYREHYLDNIFLCFNINETCKWIQDSNYSKVCLQFPDDLLSVSSKIYEEIKKIVEVDLYILGDTSYASCCVDSVAAMHVNADALVHYGHTCFSKSNIPVYMVLPKRNLDIENAMTKLKENFKSDELVKFCLFYGAEFEHCQENLAKYWFQQYPRSSIAFIELEDKQKRFQGRILKNAYNEELDANQLQDYICIYLGSRGQTLFNYTVSIPATEWYFLNPETSKIEQLEETTWFKRRRFLVEKCKDANNVGILVCKLAGDQTKEIISRMKELCKVNGKKSYIVSVGKPNIAKLANFPEIDIYVMIACPENDLYSCRDFYKPLVYPYELEVALNSERNPYFTCHITDYDELLPGRSHYSDIKHIREVTDVSLITGKIRETKVDTSEDNGKELIEQKRALESIGQNLQERSWKGLEQKLGETDVKTAEQGRKGIPLQYNNEPE